MKLTTNQDVSFKRQGDLSFEVSFEKDKEKEVEEETAKFLLKNMPDYFEKKTKVKKNDI